MTDSPWAALVARYATDKDALEEFSAALLEIQQETEARVLLRAERRLRTRLEEMDMYSAAEVNQLCRIVLKEA